MRSYREAVRRTLGRVAVAAVLLVSIPSTGISKNSTPQSRDELCARAVAEVKAAREYVKDLETRLDTAREQLKAADERAALADDKARIQSEQRALLEDKAKLLAESLDLAKQQVALLEKDRDRLIAERDSARHQRNLFTLAGVVVGAVVGALAVAAGNGP